MKEQLVKEWLDNGKQDLEVAKLIFSKKTYYGAVLFHLQQAVEKNLKGYLIYYGWKLKKIHDIEVLLTEAIKYDKLFKKYLDIGRKLTAFYFEDRYPPGPSLSYTKEEVKEMIDGGNEIINIIENFFQKKLVQ